MNMRHAARLAGVAVGSFAAAWALTGCGSVQEATGIGCADIAESEADFREEIVSLGEEVEAGTASDDGKLELRELAWAHLVLGDPQCFSAEKVAVAKVALQELGG